MNVDHVISENVFQTFFLWLLYMSEVQEGSLEVSGEYIVFRVEDNLRMEGEGDVRQIDLKKGVPSVSDEVKACLKNGKLPSKMRVKILSGEDEYVFVTDTASMEIKSISIPIIPMKELDLKLDQRVFHIQRIYFLLQRLFLMYTHERLNRFVWTERVQSIKHWVKGD